MNESVAIRQRPVMLCKWCGHPSGPGPACRVCGSPLDLRLHGVRAFSHDLYSHQRLLRPARVEASVDEVAEAPLASRPMEPDQPPRKASARSEIVTPAPMEVVIHNRPEVETGPGPVIVLESSSWWAVSPAPAVRSALRRETGRTWATRVGAFFGSVWLLDFLVTHV